MPDETSELLDLFREVMATLASGVTIVTARDPDGSPRGLTATSVASYSAAPPSVLVCVSDESNSFEALTKTSHFVVNLLAPGQSDLSERFATKDPDKFDHCDWEWWEDTVPVLAHTAAHLVCETALVAPFRDRAIVIGDVVGGALDRTESLVYWRRAYFGDLVPEQRRRGD